MTPGEHGASVRFVSFNVRYGNAADGPNHWDLRKPILLEAVERMRPDVMGVQECMPFQGDEIKMRFPHLDRVGVGRYHGVVCDSRPQESRSGEHCDVYFDTRTFIAESCGTFWHSETPDVPGSISWGNPYPRITTWAVLRSRGSAHRLVFFCTHYHGLEPCAGRATELMVRRIAEVAGDLPHVVVGDFNLTPASPHHALLTRPAPHGAGLRDVWETLGRPEQDAGTAHGFTGKPENRIDWILVSDNVKPVAVERSAFQRDGRWPSDHFPVLADCVLAPPPG